MIVLQLVDIGNFMTKLLRSELFDSFGFVEGTLQNQITYTFDGRLIRDFYSADELEAEGLSGLTYLPFSMLRPALFDLIKGKRTPGYFKFTFFLSLDDFLASGQISVSRSKNTVNGFLLNLKFQNNNLTASTGVSYRTFAPDKSLEFEWDQYIRLFFKKYAVTFTEIL